MTDAHPTTDPYSTRDDQFLSLRGGFRHNSMTGEVTGGERRTIQLADEQEGMWLVYTVAEARALRDWLNKVLKP